MRDAIHYLDNDTLITRFNEVASHSPDDEFIQLLLSEIKTRNLRLDEVLRDVLH